MPCVSSPSLGLFREDLGDPGDGLGWGGVDLGDQPVDLLARWIESGANVNASNAAQYGRTPLLTAVTSEAEGADALKLLLEHGAEITVVERAPD